MRCIDGRWTDICVDCTEDASYFDGFRAGEKMIYFLCMFLRLFHMHHGFVFQCNDSVDCRSTVVSQSLKFSFWLWFCLHWPFLKPHSCVIRARIACGLSTVWWDYYQNSLLRTNIILIIIFVYLNIQHWVYRAHFVCLCVCVYILVLSID